MTALLGNDSRKSVLRSVKSFLTGYLSRCCVSFPAVSSLGNAMKRQFSLQIIPPTSNVELLAALQLRQREKNAQAKTGYVVVLIPK